MQGDRSLLVRLTRDFVRGCLIALTIPILVITSPLWVLIVIFREQSYVREARKRKGLDSCVACGYSLIGNVSGQCPECGTTVVVTRKTWGYCLACGYNLTGNDSGRCPDCGTKVGMISQAVAGDGCLVDEKPVPEPGALSPIEFPPLLPHSLSFPVIPGESRMAKQWQCAVIGTSVVGNTHVKVLSQLPNTKLVAVCDLKPERAKEALEQHGITGIPIYKDQLEMHARHQLDVVNIATPSGVHMQSAVIAFEHHVNVIVEKPLEIRIERIDRMIESAKKHNARLAYISQNRWQEANRALKQAVDEGRFGRIAYAACFTPWYRPDEYYVKGGWRGTWEFDGGGAIMNQSIHSIDLLQWIAGPITRVSAYAASRIHPQIEVEDTLSASVRFANGAFGTIMGTTAMFPGSPARIEIGGENGTAVSEAGLKIYKFRDERPADKELLERVNATAGSLVRGAGAAADIGVDLHSRNIASILASWDQGKDAETSGEEGRKSVALINALYKSARNDGAPVDVV